MALKKFIAKKQEMSDDEAEKAELGSLVEMLKDQHGADYEPTDDDMIQMKALLAKLKEGKA